MNTRKVSSDSDPREPKSKKQPGDTPKAKCGAKTPNGPCKHPAGYQTNHPGQGRCKFHGGASPVKSGRYSLIQRPRIAELLERFHSDPDPLNLEGEIALLRALVTDYIERYDEYTEALLAWHSSFGPEWEKAYQLWRERDYIPMKEGLDLQPPPDPGQYQRKPRQVIDILQVGVFLGQIGNLAERVQKIRQTSAITLETLDRVLEQLGVEVVNAAKRHVRTDSERAQLLKDVEERWGGIQLDIPSRPRP